MTAEVSAAAADRLVSQAWTAYGADRYQEAAAAAARAVDVAGQLGDPVLLVRALRIGATAQSVLGDDAAALACYTQILGLADDPATRGRLEGPSAAEAVAVAYWSWVRCARSLPGISVPELHQVLDAAERWLDAAGHRDWRASVLFERAFTFEMLGDREAAVAAAEEALAVALQHPGAPGYALSGFRFGLGDFLRAAGRPAEAAPHYRAVLGDAAVSGWDRSAAHEGLARCALAAADLATALREARAVAGGSLGDDALCTSLDVLAEVHRAAGDTGAAWQAATGYLAAAGRIGGHYRPYFATRLAVDVALDRSDLATAQRLLGSLDEHARALDAGTSTTRWTAETARRHQRLAEAGAAEAEAAGGAVGGDPG
jgi:tetratricopeptide (TPR) repeat protein